MINRKQILQKRLSKFVAPNISPTLCCDVMGLVNSTVPNTLSYVAIETFIDAANTNANVTAIITTQKLADAICPTKTVIVVDDPTYTFWKLFNEMADDLLTRSPSEIHPSSTVHASAFVSDYNVRIGSNTVIEPNVTIYPNVSIGDYSLVRSGTVCGFDGFEHKRTKRGTLSVRHDGHVIIGDHVEIGAINSIARGFSWRDTIIESGTKTDSLVHVGHAVRIGRNCLITACVEISGSVDIGDNCWLGPNSSIINGISVGANSVVGIGSVVIRSLPENVVAAGNPAGILRIATPPSEE